MRTETTLPILTPERKRRVESAIQDYTRFIEKEEKRSADLRPKHVQDLLDQYKGKRAQLIAMLRGDLKKDEPVRPA